VEGVIVPTCLLTGAGRVGQLQPVVVTGTAGPGRRRALEVRIRLKLVWFVVDGGQQVGARDCTCTRGRLKAWAGGG
jgi:hypothetical protein